MRRIVGWILLILMISLAGCVLGEETELLCWAENTEVRYVQLREADQTVNLSFGKPKGKWAEAVFQIVTGQPEASVILEDAKDRVRLNDLKADQAEARGIQIVDKDGSMVVAAVGTINLFFDVPEETDLLQVILTADGKTVDTAVAAENQPAGNGTFITESGMEIELIPVEAAIFWEQEGSFNVKTRIGETKLPDGLPLPSSTVLPGSQIPFGMIKSSDQASMPMIVLSYSTEADADTVADEVEQMGQRIVLRIGAEDETPQSAWITDQYICLIFEREEELPEGLPTLSEEDGQLLIQYPAGT